ncbi:unnamed protein product, partial [Amoebophrya sp. A25]
GIEEDATLLDSCFRGRECRRQLKELLLAEKAEGGGQVDHDSGGPGTPTGGFLNAEFDAKYTVSAIRAELLADSQHIVAQENVEASCSGVNFFQPESPRGGARCLNNEFFVDEFAKRVAQEEDEVHAEERRRRNRLLGETWRIKNKTVNGPLKTTAITTSTSKPA